MLSRWQAGLESQRGNRLPFQDFHAVAVQTTVSKINRKLNWPPADKPGTPSESISKYHGGDHVESSAFWSIRLNGEPVFYYGWELKKKMFNYSMTLMEHRFGLSWKWLFGIIITICLQRQWRHTVELASKPRRQRRERTSTKIHVCVHTYNIHIYIIHWFICNSWHFGTGKIFFFSKGNIRSLTNS